MSNDNVIELKKPDTFRGEDCFYLLNNLSDQLNPFGTRTVCRVVWERVVMGLRPLYIDFFYSSRTRCSEKGRPKRLAR
jgi:hypothetical protein